MLDYAYCRIHVVDSQPQCGIRVPVWFRSFRMAARLRSSSLAKCCCLSEVQHSQSRQITEKSPIGTLGSTRPTIINPSYRPFLVRNALSDTCVQKPNHS